MLLLDLLSLAVLAPAWHLAGRATQRLQLPAITGIMLVSPRLVLCAAHTILLLLPIQLWTAQC
jgi:hypothetical protein